MFAVFSSRKYGTQRTRCLRLEALSEAVACAGRQRIPPAPGSSGALRSTYADYIHELQQSGASNGNRLALHAGRQNLVTHQAHH